MGFFNWYSLVPLVFALPFLVFPILYWRHATLLGNLSYFFILGSGTIAVCNYLAADYKVRDWSGWALGVVIFLAAWVRSKLPGEASEDSNWLRRVGANLLLMGASFSTLAGMWVWGAWGMLTAPPRYLSDASSEDVTPFRFGWVPLDWLSFYPNVIAYLVLGAIGLTFWRYCRLDLPLAAADVLRRALPLWLMGQYVLAITTLRKATQQGVDVGFGYLAAGFMGLVAAMLFLKDVWPGFPKPEIYPPLEPPKAGEFVYWDRAEISPYVRRLHSSDLRTNWGSPVAWLEKSAYIGALLVNVLT